MKVIFLGTPEFSVKILESILSSRHEVVGVVTQPDRKNARGNKTIFGKVKEYAMEKGLPYFQFENISKEGEGILRGLNADIMVTAAYGQILRQNILDITPHGIINVHASILPRYRGSSPVQWALINGDKEVGVTVMQTELGIDTGDIIKVATATLKGDENTEETLNILASKGAEVIVEALDAIEDGAATFVKQDESRATHCRMLTKADGKIDFSKGAEEIKNFVRGMTPWPGAYANTVNGVLKIIKSQTYEGQINGRNGEVVISDHKNGLVVKCGEGALRLLTVQGENAKAMDACVYLLGKKIPVGSIIE